MATKNKQTNTDSNIKHQEYSQLPLVKTNFILMAVAAAMIVLGFILISGGAPESADTFNPEVFSTRRIVVGPTIAFLGFIALGVGIMWPVKRKSNTENGEKAE